MPLEVPSGALKIIISKIHKPRTNPIDHDVSCGSSTNFLINAAILTIRFSQNDNDDLNNS